MARSGNMGNNRAYPNNRSQTMELIPLGANRTQINLKNGDSVFFSYRTPVACLTENGYYRTSKKWSVTTTRHINKWLDGVLAKEQPQEYFDSLVVGSVPL